MHLMDTQVLVQATDGEEVGLGVMGVLEVLEDLSHRMETSAVLEWVSMEDQDFKEVLVLDILEDGVVQGLTCRVTMNLVSQGKRKAPLAKRTWRKVEMKLLMETNLVTLTRMVQEITGIKISHLWVIISQAGVVPDPSCLLVRIQDLIQFLPSLIKKRKIKTKKVRKLWKGL